MNVIVSNRNQDLLANLDIDLIKSINGEFTPEEIAAQFPPNFYYNKMILDITAIKDYKNINVIQELSLLLDMSKVVLFLDDSETVNSPVYLSQLVSMGIYNFTKTIDAVKFLIDNPNTPSKESEQVPVTNGEQKTPNNSSLGKVTIKATALNIRSGPGTNTSIIGLFKNGDTVDIDGYEGNWIRIKISDDKYAYISGNKKYVSVEENVIQTPKSKPIVETLQEERPIEDTVVLDEKNSPTVEEPAPAVETPIEEVPKDKAPVSSNNIVPPKASIHAVETPQETPSSNESLGTAYINADSLKVRTKPNMDSEVIDYYHNGQSYEILGYEGKWIKIKTPDNHEAYISAKPEYVTIMENGTEGE